MKYEILNTRERDAVREQLQEQYGFDGSFDYVVLETNKDKFYLASADLDQVAYETLHINSVGCYFGAYDSGGFIRLSIEGSQVIGPDCSENIVDLSDEQFKDWLRGEAIPMEGDRAFKLVRHDGDFYSCGKIIDGKLKNYVPKSRTLTNILTV